MSIFVGEQMKRFTFSEAMQQLQTICNDEKACYPLAQANSNQLRAFFSNQESYSDNLCWAKYQKGERIVETGRIHSPNLTTDSDFLYSEVPLGFILKGEVVVTKGGKATKTLKEGDFIGLFETSDWLFTQQKRHTGDWTLTVDSPDTEVLYFGASSLQANNESSEKLRHYLLDISRSDKVPQAVTTQPLLDWVASHTTSSRLSEYAIVVHTHLLPNSFPFFRHLAYLCRFGRVFIMEKPYSTIRATYNELVQSGCEVVPVHMEPGMPYEHAAQKSASILWAKVIEEQRRSGFSKLLIVDDGGDLWTSLPWSQLESIGVTGIEQTQRGISRIDNTSHRIPPTVSVASSGVKKQVESIFIGKSVVDKLQQLNLLSSHRIGILGMGSIGQSVAKSLSHLGIRPVFYDPQLSGQENGKASIDTLLNESDLVIGTTGTDSLKGVAWERVSGHKLLVSASSADIEFSSLLKLIPSTSSPFETQSIEVHSGFTVEILNGGFPLNFDRKENATPDEDIVLTWCLMYAGAMQAVNLLEYYPQEEKIYGLDLEVQKKILARWIEEKGEGSPIAGSEIESIVAQTTPQNEGLGTDLWKE